MGIIRYWNLTSINKNLRLTVIYERSCRQDCWLLNRIVRKKSKFEKFVINIRVVCVKIGKISKCNEFK